MLDKTTSELAKCHCGELSQVRVVDFVTDDGDEPTPSKLERVAKAGPALWWLSARRCKACARIWLVAQEERINDVFVIREMSIEELRAVEQFGNWPDDFDKYETLLRQGQEAGHSARFADTRCATLQRTAKNLIDDRPEIADEEIADLLNVSIEDAQWLRGTAHSRRDSGLGN